MTTSTAQEFLSSIKVVGFDFDNTLVDETFSVRKRWQETLRQFNHLSPKLEEVFLRIYDEKDYKYKTHLNEALAELNLSEAEHLIPILEKLRASRSDEERVHGSVHELVTFLKDKNKRIGVITDGVQEYQEGRLKRAGLYELFDFFYYGDEYQKPDPAFFRMVLGDEKIKAHELLMIGDHVEKDIEGALAVGAKAVWIAEGSDAPVPQGALYFKTMYDFLQWLKK